MMAAAAVRMTLHLGLPFFFLMIPLAQAADGVIGGIPVSTAWGQPVPDLFAIMSAGMGPAGGKEREGGVGEKIAEKVIDKMEDYFIKEIKNPAAEFTAEVVKDFFDPDVLFWLPEVLEGPVFGVQLLLEPVPGPSREEDEAPNEVPSEDQPDVPSNVNAQGEPPQLDQPTEPDKPERPDPVPAKPERPDPGPDKPERPDHGPDKPDRPDHGPDKPDRPDHGADKPSRDK